MKVALTGIRAGRRGSGCFALNVAMLEGTLALGVVSNGLAAAVQFVFVCKQTFQTHGAASVQLAVADAQLRAQAIAEAIGKARGGVVKNAGSVDFIHEELRGALIPRKNAFGVA